MTQWLYRMQDWLLAKGIEGEVRKAGLVETTLALPSGSVSYARSRRAAQPPNEAVLMLHGAASDKTVWLRFAALLDTQLPLLIPDLPGHGKSAGGTAMSFTIATQAQRVEAMLQALGVTRVHIIGSSMGGAIAIHLAATRPQLVASMVLIGTVGIQAEQSWLKEKLRISGHNPMIEIHSTEDYIAMVHIGMSKPPYMPRFVLASLARSYIRRLPVNQKVGADIMQDLDQRSHLAAIACPVQLIWGDEDKVSHVSGAAEISRSLATSRVDILPGIGHVPMVEAPQQVAQICNRFLASLNHAGSAADAQHVA